jgi:hypothetical protein
VVAVAHDDCAQGKPHHEESQRLQTIEVTQVSSVRRTDRLPQWSE